MAAVDPQKWQRKIETLYPTESSVEAATTPSRQNVSGKADSDVRTTRRLTNDRN